MPISRLRPQDLYTGALIWERDDPLPEQLSALPSDQRKIYITVGTQESLRLGFLEELLIRLLDEDYIVILSKGKREFHVPIEDPHLYVVDFVNETKLLPMVDLYIYHGSAMSTYHGLYYGVPMISIPCQADQHFHSESLIRNGVGQLFRPVHLNIGKLVTAAGKLLDDPTVRATSKRIQAQLKAYEPRQNVLERVRQLVRADSRLGT